MRVLSYRHLTYSEVAELLKKLMDSSESVSSMITRVYEYASRMSRCSRGGEVVNELVGMGFKEVTAVMLVNNCPRSLDEVRTLLNFEDRVPDAEVLDRALKLLSDCCTH